MSGQAPRLPHGWGLTKLGEIVSLNPGRFIVEPGDEDPVSFVPMAAVEAGTGRLDVSAMRRWKEVKSGYARFQEGDVLFAKITPCMENGKFVVATGLRDGRGVGSTEFHVLRPTQAVQAKLLLYFLLQETLRRDARRSMKGAAGQLRVPHQFLGSTAFPVPPLVEQQRLVAEIEKHLTRLDAAEAALRRVRANLKRYRASVLKAACEGRLVPSEAELSRAGGRPYESADKLLDRILVERRARWEADQLARMQAAGRPPRDDRWKANYAEPGGSDTARLAALPEGWVWTTIDAVGDVLLGRQRAPQYQTGRFTRPYLRVANVLEDRIDYSDVKAMDFDEDDFVKYQLRPGDILLAEGQSPELVGRSAIYGGGIYGLCFQKTLLRFRPFDPGPDAKFSQTVFRAYLRNGVFRRAASLTVNIAHLTLERIKPLPFPLPPLAEQERIVNEVERHLSVIDELAATVDVGVRRAQRLRQAILRRAFEGKLVPQDLRDEPASALLERIRLEREATGRPSGGGNGAARARSRRGRIGVQRSAKGGEGGHRVAKSSNRRASQ